ncbi:MAG: hypothetical protein LBM66_03920 [Bifidobacteriaceae bacterium]|nr:hypothetical protein [Bifidobacteriaceae bacterium]
MGRLGVAGARMLAGNAALVVCCVFYVAWWVRAFRPVRPVKGFRSAWLLIPAAAAGLACAIEALRGLGSVPAGPRLFPGAGVLVAGLALYVVLAAVTWAAMKRPVTAELLLIVAWAVLAAAEASVLVGLGLFTRAAAWAWVAVIGAATVANLVCYVLFYRLKGRARFIDGLVPLVLAALVTAALSTAALA